VFVEIVPAAVGALNFERVSDDLSSLRLALGEPEDHGALVVDHIEASAASGLDGL
jgi:hypothetical protein